MLQDLPTDPADTNPTSQTPASAPPSAPDRQPPTQAVSPASNNPAGRVDPDTLRSHAEGTEAGPDPTPAYHEGNSAGGAGWLRTRNPYPRGSAPWHDWDRGWLDGTQRRNACLDAVGFRTRAPRPPNTRPLINYERLYGRHKAARLGKLGR